MKRQTHIDIGIGIIAVDGIKFVQRTDHPERFYVAGSVMYSLNIAHKGNTGCPAAYRFGTGDDARVQMEAAYAKLRDALIPPAEKAGGVVE